MVFTSNEFATRILLESQFLSFKAPFLLILVHLKTLMLPSIFGVQCDTSCHLSHSADGKNWFDSVRHCRRMALDVAIDEFLFDEAVSKRVWANNSTWIGIIRWAHAEKFSWLNGRAVDLTQLGAKYKVQVDIKFDDLKSAKDYCVVLGPSAITASECFSSSGAAEVLCLRRIKAKCTHCSWANSSTDENSVCTQKVDRMAICRDEKTIKTVEVDCPVEKCLASFERKTEALIILGILGILIFVVTLLACCLCVASVRGFGKVRVLKKQIDKLDTDKAN